ncbi:hypothetical protein CDL15_Pgr000299 [Punica granatum]|nr:hypothetical protein CDL15_Pgr000299 [Punica granatum]
MTVAREELGSRFSAWRGEAERSSGWRMYGRVKERVAEEQSGTERDGSCMLRGTEEQIRIAPYWEMELELESSGLESRSAAQDGEEAAIANSVSVEREAKDRSHIEVAHAL